MADWQLVQLLQSGLDQGAALLAGVPASALLAALILPVVLAAFSKQIVILLASILLAATATCIVFAPSSLALTAATAAYLGGFLVAWSGIVARRRAAAMRADLESLKGEVRRLLGAEQSRYLNDLRSSANDQKG